MSQPDESDRPATDYAGPPASQSPSAADMRNAPPAGHSAYYPAPQGFPAQGFPAQGYPPPGYPPQGYPPNLSGQGYGFQPYPYPYAMPGGPARPGGAAAAAVLMFVQAAIVLFSTFYVLFFASLASGVDAYGVSGTSSLEAEWTVIGILQLVSVGLLIFAGVQLIGGNQNARILVMVSCGVQLALVVYWMVRIGSLPEFGGDGGTFFFVVPLMYAVLPVVALSLGLGAQVRDYIAQRSAARQSQPTAG